MTTLQGKVAFITGAARGQGRSHAIRLAEEGADIIAVDLCDQIASVDYPLATADDLAETVKMVEDRGRSIVAERGDVRDRASLQRALDLGLERFGRLDVVVANAGIMPICGAAGQQVEAWHDAVNVMLTGVFNTVEISIPAIISRGAGGSIIITSSTFGLRGPVTSRGAAGAGMLGYVAAKHGTVGLMRAYANALASDNIRVNTIHPTAVNTPMVVNEAFGGWIEEHPEMVASMQNPLPVPAIEPSDVSNAVAWLASDEARYVTGVTLAVDAGFTNA